MKLIINGEERAFDGVTNVAELIDKLGIKGDRVAVELNREIIPRAQWLESVVKDGDKLEIVHFVGGGTDQRTPVQTPTDQVAQSAAKGTRKYELVSCLAFVLWIVPSAFVRPAISVLVCFLGIGVSILALIFGSARVDGKKRESILVGIFMPVLWLFLLVFSLTSQGF